MPGWPRSSYWSVCPRTALSPWQLWVFWRQVCKEAWYAGYHLLPTPGSLKLDLCKLIISSARCSLDHNSYFFFLLWEEFCMEEIMCPSVHLWFKKCTQWNRSSRNGTCCAGACRLLALLVGKLLAIILFWFLLFTCCGEFFLEKVKSIRIVLCSWLLSLPDPKHGIS